MLNKSSHAKQLLETRIIKLEDKHEINNQIGSHFKEFRESRGISQNELGISIGLPDDIAQQHIYKYEKGIIRIPIDVAVKIAKTLNVDIIINGDNMILVPR
ncbi:MAG TPA: helix-turn-helix transcriptional regulator [Thermodesulfovibrionales bacterium]|nr:helix-turn-helix transcriptional regulator [Thermodesulfovibrionales bacterium]